MDREELVTDAAQLGLVLSAIFGAVEKELRPGVTTQALDDLVKNEIRRHGVESCFVGYNGYPAYTDTSINDEVVNTPPSTRRLKDGDLLKLQIGIRGKKTYAIPGWTYPIGSVSDDDRRLLATGLLALRRAVAATRVDARTGDLSAAIQETVEAAGFSGEPRLRRLRHRRETPLRPPTPWVREARPGIQAIRWADLVPVRHRTRRCVQDGGTSFRLVSGVDRRQALGAVQPDGRRARHRGSAIDA